MSPFSGCFRSDNDRGNTMRFLVVTLCCSVAPAIVRADPTEDAVIKAIKQLRREEIEQNEA